MDRETQLKQILVELQADYRRRAQPIIDELVVIESLKPPKPLILSKEEFERFGLSDALIRVLDGGRE